MVCQGLRLWAHGFVNQEGKTKGRAYLVALVAGEGAELGRQRRPAQSSRAHAGGVGGNGRRRPTAQKRFCSDKRISANNIIYKASNENYLR